MMKEQLEAKGYAFHDDPKLMFIPFEKYCLSKGIDFEDKVVDWMYMYHRKDDGIHYYKNQQTRLHLCLSESGRDMDSTVEKVFGPGANVC